MKLGATFINFVEIGEYAIGIIDLGGWTPLGKGELFACWIAVSYLFRELLFAQFVKNIELLSEHDVLEESVAGQLHPHDDHSIWNHHSHSSKEDLQVLRKFLATSVSGILKHVSYPYSAETGHIHHPF